jgi:hypothetical protein
MDNLVRTPELLMGSKSQSDLRGTFVLDGLPLAWLGALSDGAGNEDDELAGGAALEVAEVADVRRVREHDRLRARLAAGRGAAGSRGRRLQHKERRDLHPFYGEIHAHTTSWLPRDGWIDGRRLQPRRNIKQAPLSSPVGFGRTPMPCTMARRFPQEKTSLTLGPS